jgi:hypothetical protein
VLESHSDAHARVRGKPDSGEISPRRRPAVDLRCTYAAAESGRNALGIRFTSVLPQLTPETDLGGMRDSLDAYEAVVGLDVGRCWLGLLGCAGNRRG